MRKRWQIIWVLGVVLCAVCQGARGEQMAEGWAYRRPLVFKAAVTDAPGEKVAYAEFYTNGKQKADGSDIRVTNAERMLVPMRVLQSSVSDDFVRIAFALNRGNSPYFVWWGNAEAGKGPPAMEIKQGLLAEVYRPMGGAMGTEERLRQALSRATFQGAIFEPTIFLGYNPIGEEWVPLVRYTGQFKIENAGSFELALAVQDVGYVRIDDKPVIFQRGALRDSRGAKTVMLETGWHAIEVGHTNDRGVPCGVSVSWRRAGIGNFAPMPANIFSPVARAEAGALETIGKAVTADFVITPEAEAFAPPESYFERYSFAATVLETLKPVPEIRWDFGDGQTSPLARVNHYYLVPGYYTVTLTMKVGGGSVSTATRLAVKDRMYQRFPTPPEDNFKTVRPMLATYDLEKLSTAQLLKGVEYFDRDRDRAEIQALRWGHAWLVRKDVQPDATVWETTCDLAQMYEARDDFKEAAEAFELCSQKPVEAAMQARAMAAGVRRVCDYLDDVEGAYKTAEAWKNKPEMKGDAARHWVLVGMAYAAIARGDGKAAAQCVKEAGDARPRIFEQEQVDKGAEARNVESAIEVNELDQAEDLLVEWENNYPQALLEGFTRLLRVKLLVAQKREWAAGKVAMEYATALPQSFYAAELLYRAGEAYKAGHHPEEAQRALALLKEKYPESPYAAALK